jgi:nucleotide-binding universal stress UspA family protein
VANQVLPPLSVPASSAPQETTAPKTFSVVVGLDFTDADGPAFDQAARLALRVPGSELHLVHVFATEPSAERSRQLMTSLGLYLNEKAAITSGLPGMRVGIHVRWGRAVRKLVQFAIEARADVIVIGSRHEPHNKDWVVGSTIEKLVSAASFQVLVASPRLREPEQEHCSLIEPPCTACVQTRTASVGQSWWCDHHIRAAKLAHAVSYQRELPVTTQRHDAEVIPTGIRFF